MYIVSFSSSTDTLNRDVQSLEVQVQQMKVDNESLSFEVRELSKPERITKIARDNGLKIQDAQVKRADHATQYVRMRWNAEKDTNKHNDYFFHACVFTIVSNYIWSVYIHTGNRRSK